MLLLLLLLLLLLQVARWLGERLADPYRYKYMATDNDMPLMKEHQPHNLHDRCVCVWGGGEWSTAAGWQTAEAEADQRRELHSSDCTDVHVVTTALAAGNLCQRSTCSWQPLPAQHCSWQPLPAQHLQLATSASAALAAGNRCLAALTSCILPHPLAPAAASGSH
jgi:hypothetical protein